MAKKQKGPAKKPVRKPAKQQDESLIILTDDKGKEHEFELIQLFTSGKQDFALLRPIVGEEGEMTIQKLVKSKDGALQGFEDPTDDEFKQAVEDLDAQAAQGGEECECECECCQETHERAPAKKGAKNARAEQEEENSIVLTDEDGTDHEFALVRLFTLKKKNFAVLRPTDGEDDGTLTILKFTLDKKGELKGFEDPTDAEFKAAVQELESQAAEDEECECECCQEMQAQAPAKAAKKGAKKVSAKKPAAKASAAKRLAAKKPVAKKAVAKKPAAKKAAGTKR